MGEGKFRDDLYFRLNVVKIIMPPLRDRKEDIVLLADAFRKDLAKENGKPEKELSSDALHKLTQYSWPGNVRELRTAIEHGIVMSNSQKISARHLPERVRLGVEFSQAPEPSISFPPNPNASQSPDFPNDDLNLEAMEATLIALALERTNGNRTEAAKLLGISRRTLQRKLKSDA